MGNDLKILRKYEIIVVTIYITPSIASNMTKTILYNYIEKWRLLELYSTLHLERFSLCSQLQFIAELDDVDVTTIDCRSPSPIVPTISAAVAASDYVSPPAALRIVESSTNLLLAPFQGRVATPAPIIQPTRPTESRQPQGYALVAPAPVGATLGYVSGFSTPFKSREKLKIERILGEFTLILLPEMDNDVIIV